MAGHKALTLKTVTVGGGMLFGPYCPSSPTASTDRRGYRLPGGRAQLKIDELLLAAGTSASSPTGGEATPRPRGPAPWAGRKIELGCGGSDVLAIRSSCDRLARPPPAQCCSVRF